MYQDLSDRITEEHWASASAEARQCSEYTEILKLPTQGEITSEALLTVTNRSARLALESPAILALLEEKLIDKNQIFTIKNGNTRLILESPIVRQWIKEEKLNIDQLLNTTSGQVRIALASKRIQQLVAAGILEPARILTFTDSATLYTLENRETHRRLLQHEITLNEVLAPPDNLVEENEPPLQINARQNTHTASIHRTASESATRLWSRYGKKIGPFAGIDGEIRTFLHGRQDSESAAAERCLRQLLNNVSYVDLSSGVSLQQLLYLTWLAIHDGDMRQAPLDEALTRFVRCLYEAQRDGNLNSAAIAWHDADYPACFSGIFNKLVEILDGIHPDASLEYITKETFSLKLPCIVREEAQAYLELMFFRMPQETWQTLVTDADRDLSVIWDAISDSISKRVFDEFGHLFPSGRTDEFKNELSCGRDASFQFSEQRMAENSRHFGKVVQDLLDCMRIRWNALSDQLHGAANPAAAEKIRKDLIITGNLHNALLCDDTPREKLLQFSAIWQADRDNFLPPPETTFSAILRFFKPAEKTDDQIMAEEIDILLERHLPVGLRSRYSI